MQEQSSANSPLALKAGLSAAPGRFWGTSDTYDLAKAYYERCLASSFSLRRRLFVLFFLSGFCGLVYQMVWVRLAFASFGIIAPVLSVVISVFMLGLSVGSWAGGRMIPGLVRRTGVSASYF